MSIAGTEMWVRGSGGFLQPGGYDEGRFPNNVRVQVLQAARIEAVSGGTLTFTGSIESYSPYITLNADKDSGAPSEDGGLRIRRGASPYAGIFWDESAAAWVFGTSTDGTLGGTLAGSHLLFAADNTHDIGASGATRPRNLYLAGNATIGGFLSIGNIYFWGGGGGVSLGDAEMRASSSAAANSLKLRSGTANNIWDAAPTAACFDFRTEWNHASTFTGIGVNITDTLSNAASLLMDLQVGGASKCKVTKAGAFWVGGVDNNAISAPNGGVLAYNVEATNNCKSARFSVGNDQVVGARGAAVADASGGSTVDAEARTALNTLLARLRTHGLIAT